MDTDIDNWIMKREEYYGNRLDYAYFYTYFFLRRVYQMAYRSLGATLRAADDDITELVSFGDLTLFTIQQTPAPVLYSDSDSDIPELVIPTPEKLEHICRLMNRKRALAQTG